MINLILLIAGIVLLSHGNTVLGIICIVLAFTQ